MIFVFLHEFREIWEQKQKKIDKSHIKNLDLRKKN